MEKRKIQGDRETIHKDLTTANMFEQMLSTCTSSIERFHKVEVKHKYKISIFKSLMRNMKQNT